MTVSPDKTLWTLKDPETAMTGILPSQALRTAVECGQITADTPILPDQIQPASIDLRAGMKAHRVPASFLPGRGKRVEERLQSLTMHTLDLIEGAVLEKGCVYILPLQEQFWLTDHMSARANPKSSTGRLDIFARVIIDGGIAFDDIPPGYRGPIYAEISPRTFSIRVKTGSRLVQARLRSGEAISEDARELQARDPLLIGNKVEELLPYLKEGVPFTVDVTGSASGGGIRSDLPPIVSWRARKHAGLIDVEKINHYPVLDFWEPVFARKAGGVVLDPDDFYILATKESVSVPPSHAAEMHAYDTSAGEFRVHYAGFFDPGFGHASAGGQGSRAVLEVRTHDVPFMIDEGQIVGRLSYEALTETPEILYGKEMKSNYQGQDLYLAKQFER